METARAARRGRRQNLSLQHLAPRRAGRDQHSVDRAFESFYRKHVAEVYQYALAVLTNPADAEDVTQQTFLNAYRAFQRGERPHTPHNWLIKIAHNVCRMRWRQSSRRPQEVPLEHVGDPASLEEDRPSLDEVLHTLARLPFNQRAAIVMREVEGRTYAEIADVLNTSVPAVEALLFRARTNLRARRKALGILTLAPVPGSLSSFFGGSTGGILAAGGAALGSEFLLKAAAVVVSGVVAGGLGFKAVKAVAKPEPRPQTPAPRLATPLWANPVRQIAPAERSAARTAAFAHPQNARDLGGGKLRQAPTNDRHGEDGLAPPDSSGAGSAGSIADEPAATVTKIVASVPAPDPPATPVSVPLPLPTTPTLPAVTLTVPTLPVPPPPPIK